MKKYLIATVAASLLGSSAMAHEVWLERDGNSIKTFFGHYTQGIKESGDRLNMIKANLYLPAGEIERKERATNYIEATAKSGSDIALVEAFKPRKSKLAPVISRTIFLARTGRSDNKNLLKLDLVPKTKDSDTFVITYDGEPLARTNVTLYAPNMWSMSFRSNDNGEITIKTPWKGRYFATLKHIDETKGEVDGEPYDQTSYVMTLTFDVESGLLWSEK
ncbi:MAG: DUF4198 domain-containing protein [Wolinella sp.]